MFPTEFAALIAWHQTLFRKTHSDGTLAQHCHSNDKTLGMPWMSCCCAVLLEWVKAAGTKPFLCLSWRLESTRDLGKGLLPSGAWQIARAASNSWLLTALGIFRYVAEIFTFLLAKIILIEVLQQWNSFLKEELHRRTQQLWLQTNSQGNCSKTLLQQQTTDWFWNISWCNSKQRPCILSVKREQI